MSPLPGGTSTTQNNRREHQSPVPQHKTLPFILIGGKYLDGLDDFLEESGIGELGLEHGGRAFWEGGKVKRNKREPNTKQQESENGEINGERRDSAVKNDFKRRWRGKFSRSQHCMYTVSFKKSEISTRIVNN